MNAVAKMNSELAELAIPKYTISANDDLYLTLIQGIEGIGHTYLTKLTYQQCVDYFELEDESIPVHQRLQRDAEKARIKGIINYLVERDNTVFPSACLIVTHLELELLLADELNIMRGKLLACSDRLFIDGQGRVGSMAESIAKKPDLANMHLDVKVIVVPTDTIRESSEMVRQIFSDYHLGLKKPNSSQNIFFDSEKSSSRLAKEVLAITTKLDVPFESAIAPNGKLGHGNLYTLASVRDFISILCGISSTAKLNAFLDVEQNYNLYLALISQYIKGMYQHLPLLEVQSIQDKKAWALATKESVLTCAIGLKALAYFGRSLIDDLIATESTELALDKIAIIAQLPTSERTNQLWLEKSIYQVIDGKVSIIKASEKRLARLMCNKARLLPCKELV